jgi:hypothetical protein
MTDENHLRGNPREYSRTEDLPNVGVAKNRLKLGSTINFRREKKEGEETPSRSGVDCVREARRKLGGMWIALFGGLRGWESGLSEGKFAKLRWKISEGVLFDETYKTWGFSYVEMLWNMKSWFQKFFVQF